MVGAKAAVVLIVAAALAGCANVGTEGTHSSDNKSVSNHKDSFSYALSAVNKTKSETYKWENSAAEAVVSYSGAVHEGQVTLTISDAAGLEVYQGSYTGNEGGGLSTQKGLPGVWTVDMVFDGYSGALSLSVSANHGAGP